MIALGKSLVRRFMLTIMAVMAIVAILGWHASFASTKPSPQIQVVEDGVPQLIAEAPFKKPELFVERNSDAELTVLRMPTNFTLEVRCYGGYPPRVMRNAVGQNLLECQIPQ